MSNDIEDSDEKSPCVEESSGDTTLKDGGGSSAIPGAVLVSSLIITQALDNFERVCYISQIGL